MAHQGKVSDKWSSYLIEYERLFNEFKDKSVSLLEIGVQNGGSLEIWAKYFPNARYLTGCDINENCRKLAFDDPRITVFVGDANSDEIQSAIIQRVERFDVIVDDGSHRSDDIVKSFARYFPLLNQGGIFLAEDLHCSYWKDFEGGLFNPLSSISFFKALSDIINHEHWGIPETRNALLENFTICYGVEFSDSDLSEIQSIEFLNSMCLVRKKKSGDGGLGERILSGTLAEVYSENASASRSGSGSLTPSQNNNLWSHPALFNSRIGTANTAKEIRDLKATIENLNSTIENLNSTIGKLKLTIENLRFEINEKQQQMMEITHASNQANRLIEKLRHTLFLRDNSISWKITSPFRVIMDTILRR